MTTRTAELLMAIALALLSIAFMVKSAELNIGWVENRGPGAGAWPFWLGTGMLITCLVIIYRWYRGITPESRSTSPYMTRTAVTLVGTSVAALAALLLATQYIGLYLGLILFLVFFLKIFSGHSWITTLAITLAIPVVIFCLFEWALLIPLPKGVSEPLFYPLYDLIY